MHTELLAADPFGIARAAELLQSGQPVGLPTETVYGLAANALDPTAVERIYRAKGRPSDNPLIVHVCDQGQAEQLALVVPTAASRLMEVFWPGPLTIVLPKKPIVPSVTTGGRIDVGLRSPNHPAFQAVLRASGLPLAAPSANLAGRPSPTSANHVLEDMQGRIPAVLDGGPCTVGLESTVVSLVDDSPVLLRPGGVSVEELEAVVGHLTVDAAVTGQLEAGRSPGAPGMKYRHYAPSTPITLVEGPAPSALAYIQNTALPEERVGVIAFDDEAAAFSEFPTITYGARHDDGAQARQLFNALHQVDQLEVDRVFAQVATPTTGVFLAVRNRLLKAANHHLVTVA